MSTVSMDMRDPFIASTKSNVTDAESKIVFDLFHIMKHMNMALDSARKMEARNADTKELLKKTRYLRLYSNENGEGICNKGESSQPVAVRNGE